MLKPLRLFLLSTSVAIGISTCIPTFATIQEFILQKITYPILVDGEEYTNDELPILNYNNRTYLPLSTIGEMLDSKIVWNNELKRVEIGEMPVETIFTSTPTPQDVVFSEEIYGGRPSYAIYNGTKYYYIKFFKLLIAERSYELHWQPSEFLNGYITEDGYVTKLYEIQKNEAITIRLGYGEYIKADIVKSLIN